MAIMAGTPTEKTPGLDEAAILARFVSSPADAEGHVAYALHRRALVDFGADFERHHGRAPDDAERVAFLVGETGAARIAAYRAMALAMMKNETASSPKETASSGPAPDSKARPARRLSWFGLWGAPILIDAEAGPVNWRGLLLRLFVLLLAVIATAILLRVLVVQA